MQFMPCVSLSPSLLLPLSTSTRKARAVYPCEAEHSSELSFEIGAIFEDGECGREGGYLQWLREETMLWGPGTLAKGCIMGASYPILPTSPSAPLLPPPLFHFLLLYPFGSSPGSSWHPLELEMPVIASLAFPPRLPLLVFQLGWVELSV